MPVVAVIPIRSFRLAKLRLAGALLDGDRHRLGRAMATHTLEAVEGAGMVPLVVTADGEVADWATSRSAELVPDPGQGLDRACQTGVEATREARWAVIHADLPLVETRDMDSVRSIVESGRPLIAPSSDGGTSVLAGTESVRFSYGAGSFHRHLSQLHDPVVLARTGFLHDLDTPDDLESALGHRRGGWLGETLSGLPNPADTVY